MSIRDWFIEPRPTPPRKPPGAIATPPVAGDVRTAFAPPADAVADASGSSAGDVATALAPRTLPAGTWAPPAPERVRAAPRPFQRAHDSAAARALEPRDDDPRPPLSAAVVGRAGDAEPVAAAVALGLRGAARAAAAAVVVVAAQPAPHVAAGTATRGARRLAARLSAHGFEASARGRLAWVHVPEAAARRAAGIGAPSVVAVTVPLTPALESVVAEQDLAIVVAPGGDGPLARVAVASLACPGLEVRFVPPLPRGVARLLARAGLRAPPHLRPPE